MEKTPLQELISLKGKTAIVTGGAAGIGFGIAYRLAEAGASIVIADVNKKVGDAVVKELREKGWKSSFVKTDVSDEKQVKKAVLFALQTYKKIDILVNNAGIYPFMPVMQMSLADFDRILAVNLKGVFLFTKAVADSMIQRKRGGKIITITSIDALHPSSVGLAAYDASKHGLLGFIKNTALELAPHQIYMNAIAPGGIVTPGTGAGKPVSQEMEVVIKKFIEKIPMKRMGDPDEIGKAALFLASDLSSYMTGSQIIIDGGVLLS